MKQILKDDYSEVYVNDAGSRIVLTRDNSIRNYWSVWIKTKAMKRGKTIATRCTYEKAMQIAKQQ